MEEDKIVGSPLEEDEETVIPVRKSLDEFLSRKPFEHTWDVAVPGEEDIPLLPKPDETLKSVDTDSEKGNASEGQADDEPEVLIQFENQEENLLSRYESEDSCENEDSYDYGDEQGYGESYDYGEAYDYEGMYDYNDVYGLNQLLLAGNIRMANNLNNVTLIQNLGLGISISYLRQVSGLTIRRPG